MASVQHINNFWKCQHFSWKILRKNLNDIKLHYHASLPSIPDSGYSIVVVVFVVVVFGEWELMTEGNGSLLCQVSWKEHIAGVVLQCNDGHISIYM